MEEDKIEISKEEMKAIESGLNEIKKNIDYLVEATGAGERYRKIKSEIKMMGWNYIQRTYHPDINCDDPAAVPLYEFYKFAYRDMLKKNEI
jgi:hypothetical protein